MPQSNPEANTSNATTNTTTNTTTVRDIGLTGEAGSRALADILAVGASTIQGGYAFGGEALARAADLQQGITDRLGASLDNVVNASRDISQRTIAAGIGQASPLTVLPAANTTNSQGSVSPTLLLVGAGLLVLMLFMR